MKYFLINLRRITKFLIIICIATFIIGGIVSIIFKPIYKVTLNGEQIGYCKYKSKLQTKIDNYIEHGNGDNENLAFVEIDDMPQYEMCLLKRGITTNDDEIFNKVIANGSKYYNYFAIVEDGEEKFYVENYKTAEAIINELKEKDSDNIENLDIKEKYSNDLKEFSNVEQTVASLYKEKPVEEQVVTRVAKNYSTTTTSARSSSGSTKGFSTSANVSNSKVSLGVSLIQPVTGKISSKFGAVSRIRSSVHTGLDIATSSGTPIKAAASGKVTFAGWKGSYGNLLVITHSNGVQTYYGHCSKLYVSAGQSVSQGQTVAAVGSTGNSTGPHLHLEIRVNGVAYNPQKYLY